MTKIIDNILIAGQNQINLLELPKDINLIFIKMSENYLNNLYDFIEIKAELYRELANEMFDDSYHYQETHYSLAAEGNPSAFWTEVDFISEELSNTDEIAKNLSKLMIIIEQAQVCKATV